MRTSNDIKMSQRETLIGALVGTELERIKGKFDFYEIDAKLPSGKSWISPIALTLEQYLDKHPSPESPDETVLYGIAWEFVWGKKPPVEINMARHNLLVRSRTGMPVTEMEKLWLKLIAVDTDMF